MGKFCGQCGAQLIDGARVCGQCGTPIGGSQGKISEPKDIDTKEQVNPKKEKDPEKEKAPKKEKPPKKEKVPKEQKPLKKQKPLAKKIKTAAVLLIVTAVVIAGIRFALNFTGTSGLVKKVIVAYKRYDIEILVAISSDVYRSGSYEDVREYFESAVGQDLDSFEESVGHSYKITYEVDEIYELSPRKRDELMKNIEHTFPDIDPDLIGKACVANVSITAEQGSESASKDIVITMVKEGSAWKLLYIE